MWIWSKKDNKKLKIKLNLWLTAPKGATPVNQTSATNWQMAVGRDNVISITLRQDNKMSLITIQITIIPNCYNLPNSLL